MASPQSVAEEGDDNPLKAYAVSGLKRFLAAWRWWLIPLFVGMPALELFLLLQIGALMGPTTTFLIILFTGMLGAWLAKREGINVLRTLRDELKTGVPPGTRIMEGALVLGGGLLLLTPGVFTDIMGFSLIAPPTRRLLAGVTLEALLQFFDIDARIDMNRVRKSNARSPGSEGPSPFSSPFDDLP